MDPLNAGDSAFAAGALAGGIGAALRAAGTTSPTGIDRAGYVAAQAYHGVAAIAGAPTSFTVDTKLQHGDAAASGDGSWADAPTTVAPGTGSISLTTLVAANTEARKAFILTPCKQFVRLQQVVAFVAGTSPTAATDAVLILMGPIVKPVAL